MLIYRWTPYFEQDMERLEAPEVGVFKNALQALEDTSGSCQPLPEIQIIPPWPTMLAVQPIRGSINDIHSMTWGFNTPGYATFQWSFEGSDLVIVFRRIGGKSILEQ